MSDKPFAPSAQKLRRARKEGNVPRSHLAVAGMVTASSWWVCLASLPGAARHWKVWLESLWTHWDLTPTAALDGLGPLVFRILGPVLVASNATAICASWMVSGFNFSPQLALPKGARVSIASGVTSLVRKERLWELGKGMGAIVLLGCIAWNSFRDSLRGSLHGTALCGDMALLRQWDWLQAFVLKAMALFVALGALDAWLARRRYARELGMTLDEMKREHRENEGNPQQKAFRRAQHRQGVLKGPARGLQAASVLVVNPTRLAVALRYDESECEAPYIVAKGSLASARALRTEAARLGVPILRNVPLARSLIGCTLGEVIPEELYQAAAAILKVAFERHAVYAVPEVHP